MPAPVAKRAWTAHCLKPASPNPPGLATDGKNLYVADSESNIIRAIDLAAGKSKLSLVVTCLNLVMLMDAVTMFGLQHPLGVFALDGKVLIADTYNHKIKQLDPASALG